MGGLGRFGGSFFLGLVGFFGMFGVGRGEDEEVEEILGSLDLDDLEVGV